MMICEEDVLISGNIQTTTLQFLNVGAYPCHEMSLFREKHTLAAQEGHRPISDSCFSCFSLTGLNRS